MVDKSMIAERISRIRSALLGLRQLSKAGEVDFVNDSMKYAASERMLHVAIEACLDIGAHIITEKGLERPMEYKDIFLTLGREKILPMDFAESIVPMAQFRNRLVHLYWRVTPSEVYRYLQSNLSDYEKFIIHIEKFLQTQ